MKELDLRGIHDEGFRAFSTHISSGNKKFQWVHDGGLMSERIITPHVSPGEWGKAYYHKGSKKCIFVERGWVVYAEMLLGAPRFTKLSEGSFKVVPVGESHNIFFPNASIINIWIYGSDKPIHANPARSGKDIWEDQKLQALCDEANQNHILNNLYEEA